MYIMEGLISIQTIASWSILILIVLIGVGTYFWFKALKEIKRGYIAQIEEIKAGYEVQCDYLIGEIKELKTDVILMREQREKILLEIQVNLEGYLEVANGIRGLFNKILEILDNDKFKK